MPSALISAGVVQGTERTTQSGKYNPLAQSLPLRESPLEPDRYDAERIARYTGEYAAQTEVLLVRDRQIEYNVRMLCGQQRNVWHAGLGQFFDVTRWLSDDEKSWRQLVVINKEQRWFVVTHARMTENTPILTMLPGPDRIDAQLAEVCDTLFKKDWRDAGMESVHDELMMWVIAAGRAHCISRIDPTKGEWRPWVGEAQVPMVDQNRQPLVGPDGQPMLSPPVPNVPMNADGSPNAEMTIDGQLIPLGPPHMERAGEIAVDVYSPLQVRGQWGPQPWHKKRWHTVQRFLTPEEVFEQWGVEVEPDLMGDAAANVATLERVLYGSGFYGQALGRLSGWTDARTKGPLCTVYHRTAAPIPFNEKLLGTWAEPLIETPENPGGRETIWTPTTGIFDGARKVAWPFTSPVRCFDFVRLPGRPSGVTPLETLHGPQRAYNQSRQQQMEHAALLGNPQIVIDEESGMQAAQITNAPGEIYTASARRPNVPPVEYIIAPPLSSDVYKVTEYAASEIDDLGGLRGTEGAPPTDDPSGELIKELRFNADRLLGATMRRAVAEYARMAQDFQKLWPLIYSEKSVIAINGEDSLAETITVFPELFTEGRVNVTPDVESMLPEGRGERQQRAQWMWTNGAFGDPMSEDAREVFFERARFPNYSRLMRPGGVDAVTAMQENGKFLTGELNQPVLEWYDHFVHLRIHERYMKSPEFLKQPPIVQQALAFHRMQHLVFAQRIMQQQAAMEAPPPGGPEGSAGDSSSESQPASPDGESKTPKSVGGRSPTSPSRSQG